MTNRLITFGWHLDGQRSTQPANSLGVSVFGPLGFLTFLETQLGLMSLYPSQAERIVQYRNCLQRFNLEDRFYHRSFAVDPQGTAACLLDWRDQWTLHGWDGSIPGNSSQRLQDMADVEAIAESAVSANVGQRLKAVKDALQKRKPDIGKVQVIDPLDSFPSRWQSVLVEFPVEIAEQESAGAGFLGALQSNLRKAAAGQEVSKLAWQDDGTVIVVQSETRTTTAHWIATQLGDEKQTLLISGGNGASLDAYLSAAGHSRQCLKESSAFRPALQLLPLTTELIWKPLNYYALVQFLTHPVCPIPGYARRKLAEKVAEAPGIGGERWEQTLGEIDEHYGPEKGPEVRERISLWVEHSKFPLEDGANIDSVIERVGALAKFFHVRLGEPDYAKRLSFHAGYGQCKACLESLKTLLTQGIDLISQRQLQKLVDQATANGSENPLWPAEVGAWQLATHPGAAFEPADQVIWWQLVMPVLPGNPPWSSIEIRDLRQAGAALPEVMAQLDQASNEWLRPVMTARKQLLLVLPPPSEEVHPLWQMIGAVVDQPKVIQLEALLKSGSKEMTAVTHVPLPAPKRWWKLPKDVTVALRDKESFSSLEKLLFNPYQWLLQYPAALHSSLIINLGDDSRIKGNLAHGLADQFFAVPNALGIFDADFEFWFAKSFAKIIDQEGAIFRVQGRGADLENFRFQLYRALLGLRQQFAQANTVSVSCEQEVSGKMDGRELAGSADLVIENMQGQFAIVDMKWFGGKKYPEKLKKNSHLQLAIYAELLRQETKKLPSVAYYILSQASLFASDSNFFPGAKGVPSANGENIADIWQRFLKTWRWRVEQIRAGNFEAVLERTEPTAESTPPADGMEIETLSETYNDYRALAGWES